VPGPKSLKAAHRDGWQIREKDGWVSAHHPVFGAVGAQGRTGLLKEIQAAVDKWVPPRPVPVREKRVPEPKPDELRPGSLERYGTVGNNVIITPLE
jgi:hypothetical protein